MSPAVAGALCPRVERDIGITVSIGLSANKFLAKIASDLDKPRGFAVLGQDEAARSWPASRSASSGASARRARRASQRDGFAPSPTCSAPTRPS
jgi:DNA polymerase-4